jgi:hypothetical protein
LSYRQNKFGGWHEVCILEGELSPMTPVSQHQRRLQACTSITKAGQPMGAQMLPCVANWLKQQTDSGCLA